MIFTKKDLRAMEQLIRESSHYKQSRFPRSKKKRIQKKWRKKQSNWTDDRYVKFIIDGEEVCFSPLKSSDLKQLRDEIARELTEHELTKCYFKVHGGRGI